MKEEAMERFRMIGIMRGLWLLIVMTWGQPLWAEGLEGDYRLGPGDKLQITVLQEERLTLEVLVSQQGTISFPILGQVQVSGHTAAQLESSIRSRLNGAYIINPVVTVNILEHRPFYVGGAVEKPGAFPYAPGMTVQQAIALAGGLSQKGGGEVFVTHEGKTQPEPKPVDLQAMVGPGDHLDVATAEVVVDGEVKEPGVFPFTKGMTISKAIALAGGRTERASSTILLIHAKDPEHVAHEVDLFEPLEPGDMIRVEESFF